MPPTLFIAGLVSPAYSLGGDGPHGRGIPSALIGLVVLQLQDAFGDDDSGLLAVDAEVEELGEVERKITLEIETYRKIVTAIDETIRLIAEIDRAIPSWPVV